MILFAGAIGFAPAALAQAPVDLAVTAFKVDKLNVVTGEKITATATMRNNGPAVRATMRISSFFDRFFPVSAAGPAGWTCTADAYFGMCTTESFPAGGEADFRFEVLAPANIPVTAAVLEFSAITDVRDQVPDNNTRRSLSIIVKPSARRSELALTIDTPRLVPVRTAATTAVHVDNRGPDDARNVRIVISGLPQAVTAEGDGWTCERAAEFIACRRDRIAVNEDAPVQLSWTTPSRDAFVNIFASTQAEEALHGSASMYARTAVGNAADWERLLVPITATNIPGDAGSLWKTDITMLFRGTEKPEVHPAPCELSPIPECSFYIKQAPLNVPFDAHETDYVGAIAGQFVWVRHSDAARVHLNARVYDVSRAIETAGAEIPVVREDEFTTEPIALLNIPISRDYRHTLRIYHAEQRPVDVSIRLFANDDPSPRVTTTQTVQPPRYQNFAGTVGLPVHPAYAELPLAQLGNLNGVERVRVEVASTDGTRIWAFVSITNNRTHHVTTVSPQ